MFVYLPRTILPYVNIMPLLPKCERLDRVRAQSCIISGNSFISKRTSLHIPIQIMPQTNMFTIASDVSSQYSLPILIDREPQLKKFKATTLFRKARHHASGLGSRRRYQWNSAILSHHVHYHQETVEKVRTPRSRDIECLESNSSATCAAR